MSPQRREFLAAIIGTAGLTIATPRTAMAYAQPAPTKNTVGDLVLLRTDSVHDRGFAQGVRLTWQALGFGTPRELRIDTAVLRNPAALHASLDGCRGARIAVLLEDSAHLLLEETLRDLGGSVLAYGSHADTAEGASRHRFLTVPASAGIGLGLAQRVGAVGQTCLVRETLLGIPRIDAPTANLPPCTAANWPTLLGGLYAAVAGDAWRSQPAVDVMTATQLSAMGPTHLATSLIAEL